ncbi:MAG TPA: site-2 protease family protein [Anaerolineales bacterium]|nr:site-2 protease family protein [Anaerolineales bacterium]
MRWQWKLGRFAGIDVYVHATFILLIGWVAYNYWLEFRDWGQVLIGILFILALFICVVLHEYGHALTARKYGIKTRDITLYPIGGVARLERIPDHPLEELWVALAGPAVNLVISALLIMYLVLTNNTASILNLDLSEGSFLQRLLAVNVSLVLFNLIPAFPMDGGRILRALLALKLEYTHATQIAAYIGQGFALLFGLIGLFSNPFLVFVALFVWIGASQEASMVLMKTSISGIPVTRAMQTDFQILSPSDTLGRAVELILSGAQQDFPVAEDGRVVGILDRDRLILALSQNGQSALVRDGMLRDVPEIDSHDMVETAIQRLQESGAKTLPVIHRNQLVGLITAENITEFLMIRSALKAARKASVP